MSAFNRWQDKRVRHLGRELLRELLELGKLFAKIHLAGVEENGEDSLGCAGVIDHLVGKEDVGIERALGSPVVRFVGTPLEEEDQAMHGPARTNAAK